MRQIAIFGGTFDPVHLGHLIVAETALHQVSLEQVIWVPSLNPPHKQAALFEHRLAMIQHAIADNPGFRLAGVEANRPGTSYAIDTLIDLSAVYPQTQWYWIVGLDTFRTLPRWYRVAELAKLCHWLIAPRLLSCETKVESEFICTQVEEQMKEQYSIICWQLLHVPLLRVSSSLIRNLCRDRHSIRYLVPESVRNYITHHNLYAGYEGGKRK